MDDGRGLRSTLLPAVCFTAAVVLHGLLFLIPGGGPSAPVVDDRVRGVRVKTSAPPVRPAVAPVARPPVASPLQAPTAVRSDTPFSTPGVSQEQSGAVAGGNSESVAAVAGSPSPSGPQTAAVGKDPGRSEFGDFLGKLRSSDVQGWAKDSAQKSRQGWKGTGSGGGTAAGWGGGESDGTGGGGNGGGTGGGPGGTGSGRGGGIGSGSGYLDSRVKMVVTSYPPTGIEKRYTRVAYPDVKFKKHQAAAGWINVYFQIRTGPNGEVGQMELMRPENPGNIEKVFIEQVRREISKWSFDSVPAEVIVDVRFYVE